jgi:predicted nucleic acid-binding Zn ribbon protein
MKCPHCGFENDKCRERCLVCDKELKTHHDVRNAIIVFLVIALAVIIVLLLSGHA